MTTDYSRHKQRIANAALQQDDVAELKWMLQHGANVKELAASRGVAPETLRRIGRGDAWSWVLPRQPGTMRADLGLGEPVVDMSAAERSALLFTELMNRTPVVTEALPPATAKQRAQLRSYGTPEDQLPPLLEGEIE